MKKIIPLLLIELFICGCTTTKIPQLTSVDQSSRMVALSYDYGALEIPKVQMDKALLTASSQCQSWGYKDAGQYGDPQNECKRRDQH